MHHRLIEGEDVMDFLQIRKEPKDINEGPSRNITYNDDKWRYS